MRSSERAAAVRCYCRAAGCTCTPDVTEHEVAPGVFRTVVGHDPDCVLYLSTHATTN